MWPGTTSSSHTPYSSPNQDYKPRTSLPPQLPTTSILLRKQHPSHTQPSAYTQRQDPQSPDLCSLTAQPGPPWSMPQPFFHSLISEELSSNRSDQSQSGLVGRRGVADLCCSWGEYRCRHPLGWSTGSHNLSFNSTFGLSPITCPLCYLVVCLRYMK